MSNPVLSALRKLHQKLDRVLENQEKTMGQLEDLAAQFDSETNAVASRIDTLTSALQQAQSSNQAPSPDTIAKLQAISTRLKTLGSDPSNPIPPGAPDASSTPPT